MQQVSQSYTVSMSRCLQLVNYNMLTTTEQVSQSDSEHESLNVNLFILWSDLSRLQLQAFKKKNCFATASFKIEVKHSQQLQNI